MSEASERAGGASVGSAGSARTMRARGQGAVLVPADLAGPLARLAIVGAKALSERDGGLVFADGLHALLAALDAASRRGAVRTVDVQARSRPAVTGEWCSVREASELTGLSRRQIQDLAHRGRLIARRPGRDWQVGRESATDYARSRRSA